MKRLWVWILQGDGLFCVFFLLCPYILCPVCQNPGTSKRCNTADFFTKSFWAVKLGASLLSQNWPETFISCVLKGGEPHVSYKNENIPNYITGLIKPHQPFEVEDKGLSIECYTDRHSYFHTYTQEVPAFQPSSLGAGFTYWTFLLYFLSDKVVCPNGAQ